MNHTPGPWKVDSEGPPYVVVMSEVSDSGCGLKYAVAVGGGNEEANARLIAAAPTMLEVLEEVEECSRYWSEYDVPIGLHDRIKAAIAEARVE